MFRAHLFQACCCGQEGQRGVPETQRETPERQQKLINVHFCFLFPPLALLPGCWAPDSAETGLSFPDDFLIPNLHSVPCFTGRSLDHVQHPALALPCSRVSLLLTPGPALPAACPLARSLGHCQAEAALLKCSGDKRSMPPGPRCG